MYIYIKYNVQYLNILQMFHVLQTFFTSLYVSKITAKHEKQLKYFSIFHEANMQ